MNGRKITLRYFSIMDYEKEAAYLSKMHQKGWKFTRVHLPGIYHFQKCEPANIKYQLDYNEDGRENIDEYTQMFSDMGWEYMFDFVGYSYFRKPVEDITDEDNGIFCDDDSRFDLIKRIFRAKMIPLILIFFAMLIPLIHNHGTENELPQNLVVCEIILLILYVTIFIKFAIKYFSLTKRLGR